MQYTFSLVGRNGYCAPVYSDLPELADDIESVFGACLLVSVRAARANKHPTLGQSGQGDALLVQGNRLLTAEQTVIN